MRKPPPRGFTLDAALLLTYGVGLLVCHGSDHGAELDRTIGSASRGVGAPALTWATSEWSAGTIVDA
jgi:hypothetical protein